MRDQGVGTRAAAQQSLFFQLKARIRRVVCLRAAEAGQINATASSSGNDVILDALLLRLHTETACRRGGALAIRLQDLDTDRCLIKLREKGSTVR